MTGLISTHKWHYFLQIDSVKESLKGHENCEMWGNEFVYNIRRVVHIKQKFNCKLN